MNVLSHPWIYVCALQTQASYVPIIDQVPSSYRYFCGWITIFFPKSSWHISNTFQIEYVKYSGLWANAVLNYKYWKCQLWKRRPYSFYPLSSVSTSLNCSVYLVSAGLLVFNILNFVQTKGKSTLFHMLVNFHMRMTL